MKLEPDDLDHDVTLKIAPGHQAYTETRSGSAQSMSEDGSSKPLATSSGVGIPLMLACLTLLVLAIWLADALRARRDKSASGRHDQPLH